MMELFGGIESYHRLQTGVGKSVITRCTASPPIRLSTEGDLLRHFLGLIVRAYERPTYLRIQYCLAGRNIPCKGFPILATTSNALLPKQ